MNFHIVDFFLDEKQKWVIIIPTNWMNSDRSQCVIPHVKGGDLKKLSKSKAWPQRDWICYHMKFRKSYRKFSFNIHPLVVSVILFIMLSGTYNEAREDLSRAEMYSDLNTVSELQGIQMDVNGRKTSRRIRKPRDCYSPTVPVPRVNTTTVGMENHQDDSSDESEDEEELPRIPTAAFRNVFFS